MQLYKLGRLPWAETQLIYHALARLGREAVVLCYPARPYVCLGFHQDMTQELDLAFCRSRGLSIFRRETGGGAVYLDGDQAFWQLVLRRDNPLVPFGREKFYRRFLTPVIAAYRRIGLMAQVFQLNDLAVESCKVSGTGAGEIGDSVVFVGNVLRDFDLETMARVIRAPNEAFRRRFKEAMAQNLSHIRGVLGDAAVGCWGVERLQDALAQAFGDFFGGLEPAGLDEELQAEMARLGERMLAPDWVHFKRKPRPGRVVKVRAGLYIHHRVGPGGFSAVYALEDGRLRGVELEGPWEDSRLQSAAARLEGIRPPEALETLQNGQNRAEFGQTGEVFAELAGLFI